MVTTEEITEKDLERYLERIVQKVRNQDPREFRRSPDGYIYETEIGKFRISIRRRSYMQSVYMVDRYSLLICDEEGNLLLETNEDKKGDTYSNLFIEIEERFWDYESCLKYGRKEQRLWRLRELMPFLGDKS